MQAIKAAASWPQDDALFDAADHGRRDGGDRPAADLRDSRHLGADFLIACRLIQGFGLGGEWGGAVLMAVEHAPEDKKGFYGSWPQLGAPLGLVLGTLVFSLVSWFLPDAELYAWGWRLPFLFSIVLVIVGLWIRFTIAESPEFQKVKDAKEERRSS